GAHATATSLSCKISWLDSGTRERKLASSCLWMELKPCSPSSAGSSFLLRAKLRRATIEIAQKIHVTYGDVAIWFRDHNRESQSRAKSFDKVTHSTLKTGFSFSVSNPA